MPPDADTHPKIIKLSKNYENKFFPSFPTLCPLLALKAAALWRAPPVQFTLVYLLLYSAVYFAENAALHLSTASKLQQDSSTRLKA